MNSDENAITNEDVKLPKLENKLRIILSMAHNLILINFKCFFYRY